MKLLISNVTFIVVKVEAYLIVPSITVRTVSLIQPEPVATGLLKAKYFMSGL